MATPQDVKFLREESGRGALGAQAVKRIYSAPSKSAAIAFLRATPPVDQRMLFIEVETPDGRFGKDVDGIYDERRNLDEFNPSSSPAHRITLILGNTVPMQSLRGMADAISKSGAGGTIFCAPSFDAAMSSQDGVGNKLLTYRILSPCTLIYSFKLPNSAVANHDRFNLWFKESVGKSLIALLNDQGFDVADMPKTRIEICAEDSSCSVVSTWSSVNGSTFRKYALAIEAACSAAR